MSGGSNDWNVLIPLSGLGVEVLMSWLQIWEEGTIQKGLRGTRIKAKSLRVCRSRLFSRRDVGFGWAPVEIYYEDWLGGGWRGGEGELEGVE